jgi:hypothetical protein
MICHVNCDRRCANAKRLLFSRTRELSRESFILERIRAELIGALKADDELVRLDQEARGKCLKKKDEDAQKNMRRLVAKLLCIDGGEIAGRPPPGRGR